MKFEQKVFKNKRFDAAALAEYGFVDKDACFLLERGILNNDFTAEIRVFESGKVTGRVLDNMNGEEYVQLRMESVTGAYVGSVREAYEKILRDIADKCCSDAAFQSNQSNRIADLILEEFSVEPDFPWDKGKYEPAGVFRHSDSKKWFALIMNIDRRLLDRSSDEDYVDVMNLKAFEDEVDGLVQMEGIYPAYHMNHKKWISITLDDTLSDEGVMKLVRESFSLTSGGFKVINEKLIKEVLKVADSIPAGYVASYGQIAGMVGRPKNARLVGKIMSMADRYGDHPCHRVVNHAGRTVPGWEEQRGLLEAEGVTFKENGYVDMSKHRL